MKDMKTILTLLSTSILALVFVSCEESINDNVPNYNSFSFLQKGNSWSYKMKIDGNDAPADISYKVESIDQDGYCEILFTSTSSVNHTKYIWYSNKDFFADESGSERGSLFPLFYKSNQIGKKWTSQVEDEDLGFITREIISTNESLVVPAGVFSNCIKVKETFRNDLNIVNFYFLSQQVGIIKKESVGWADINGQPRVYFPITIELKIKNF